jgi:hypothetical protein
MTLLGIELGKICDFNGNIVRVKYILRMGEDP